MPGAADRDFTEAVLRLVERIPPGRVMAYGWIAAAVGHGGPRRVARVMSTDGGGTPWWRVTTGGGRLPPGHEVEARRRLLAEGAVFRGSRVLMAASGWYPEELPDPRG